MPQHFVKRHQSTATAWPAQMHRTGLAKMADPLSSADPAGVYGVFVGAGIVKIDGAIGFIAGVLAGATGFSAGLSAGLGAAGA